MENIKKMNQKFVRRHYRVNKILYPFCKFFFRLEAEGLENLKGLRGPLIFAANHGSYIDPFIFPSVMEKNFSFLFPIRFVSGAWFWQQVRFFPVRLIISFFGSFPVARGLDLSISLEKATDILKEGGCVGIFPEGMRAKEGDIKTGNGKLQQGKRGVAFMARELGVPVVPVALLGVWRLLNFWRVVSRQRNIKVIFGQPIKIEKEESLEHGADRVMQNIKNLLETHSLFLDK